MSKQKHKKSGKGRIQKTEVSSQKSSESRIQLTKLAPPPGISFSFKYLDTNNDKFSVSGKNKNYWMVLLERLKALSAYTAVELRQEGNKTLRCHPINWNDQRVTERGFGFPKEEQLVNKPYQLSLSSNEHGRIHGFFIEDVFFLVWLDPEHRLFTGNEGGCLGN